MLMKSFSVYHQVYNNKPQTRLSISSFRKLYPDIHFRLVCDGGVDHTDIASEFNCEYIHDTFNTGVFDSLNPKVISGQHRCGWTKEERLVFINRIYSLCKYVNTDLILFSEDDVTYSKPLTIINEDFDITGIVPGNKFPQTFVDFMSSHFLKFNGKEWGCCAGNFFKRKTYIFCYENCIDFIEQNYDYIINNVFTELGWTDVLLNVIFATQGTKYINNYDYSEKTTDSPIYHDKISPRVRNN